MHLLGQHLRGHFEVHEEVFAVLVGHGRGEQGRGQQTNSECDDRPTSEHKSSQRIHRKEHGSGRSEIDGRSRKRKVTRDFSPVRTQPLYDVECAMFRVEMITRLP